MTVHTKRAAVVVTVFLTFAVYRVVSDVLAPGALGVVSAGDVLDFILPSVLVGLVFFLWWRHRRQARRQSPAPRP